MKQQEEKVSEYNFFDGFGKPGGGAPVRGSNGKPISDIKNVVYSKVTKTY